MSEAREVLQKAVQDFPKDPSVHHRLLAFYVRKRQNRLGERVPGKTR